MIEKKILEKDPNKRIILVVNKIDLVPKNIAFMVIYVFVVLRLVVELTSSRIPHYSIQSIDTIAT